MGIRDESDLVPHITGNAETDFLGIKGKISTLRPKDFVELEEAGHVSQIANERQEISQKYEAKKDEPEPENVLSLHVSHVTPLGEKKDEPEPAKSQQVLPAPSPNCVQAMPPPVITVLPSDPALQDVLVTTKLDQLVKALETLIGN